MSADKSILNTIHYFDIFNFPLTARETHANLFEPDADYSFVQVQNALTELTKTLLENKEGVYFFKGKAENVARRKERYIIVKNKLRRANFLIKLISQMPGVRAVFICNDVAYENAPDDSDIDLAIITAPNRIWTARFFTTLLTKITNNRPTPRNRKNKICLSFYLSETNLNLERVAYPNDIHFYYWLSQFQPTYGDADAFERFYSANVWLLKRLPNLAIGVTSGTGWTGETGGTGGIGGKKQGGSYLEKLLKKIQISILPSKLKLLSEQNNTDVIINDEILKFHDKDNRMEILRKWKSGAQAIQYV